MYRGNGISRTKPRSQGINLVLVRGDNTDFIRVLLAQMGQYFLLDNVDLAGVDVLFL